MHQLEKDFKIKLHEKLKESINAKIYVNITDDLVIVEISKKDFHFNWAMPDLSTAICNGRSVEDISDTIIRQYKNAVMKTYFY